MSCDIYFCMAKEVRECIGEVRNLTRRTCIAVMVISCCVPFCAKRAMKETKEKGIQFYRLSQDPIKRGLWLTAINRKDYSPRDRAQHTSAASISLAVSYRHVSVRWHVERTQDKASSHSNS